VELDFYNDDGEISEFEVEVDVDDDTGWKVMMMI